VSDFLNGKTYLAGVAGIAGLRWSFTRSTTDTTDYLNSAIALRVFELDSKGNPLSDIPALSLSLSNGIIRTTNTSVSQAGVLSIDANQCNNLLGAIAKKKQFSYVWIVTPSGGVPLRNPLGEGYSGRFYLVKEGYAGIADPSTIR